jgi:hypothetical protein
MRALRSPRTLLAVALVLGAAVGLWAAHFGAPGHDSHCGLCHSIDSHPFVPAQPALVFAPLDGEGVVAIAPAIPFRTDSTRTSTPRAPPAS